MPRLKRQSQQQRACLDKLHKRDTAKILVSASPELFIDDPKANSNVQLQVPIGNLVQILYYFIPPTLEWQTECLARLTSFSPDMLAVETCVRASTKQTQNAMCVLNNCEPGELKEIG